MIIIRIVMLNVNNNYIMVMVIILGKQYIISTVLAHHCMSMDGVDCFSDASSFDSLQMSSSCFSIRCVGCPSIPTRTKLVTSLMPDPCSFVKKNFQVRLSTMEKCNQGSWIRALGILSWDKVFSQARGVQRVNSWTSPLFFRILQMIQPQVC